MRLFYFALFVVVLTAAAALSGMWEHPDGIPSGWDGEKFLTGAGALVISGAGVLIALRLIAAAENLRRKNDTNERKFGKIHALKPYTGLPMEYTNTPAEYLKNTLDKIDRAYWNEKKGK